MKKICILFLAYICFTTYSIKAQNLSQQIDSIFQKSEITGIAMAIVNSDSILFSDAFGYADLATKKPYTLQTIHNIGSTSKTFIGVALMQLEEKGKINLDTDINEYLPFKVSNPHFPNIPITLRQLATHTSTIRDRTSNYDLKAYYSNADTKGARKGLPLISKIHFKRMLKNKQMPLGEFLEQTLSENGEFYKKKSFYKFKPGTQEEYTNIGSALAGYIVELVSGEKYSTYVQNNILTPLKMNSSSWSLNEENKEDFAKRYIKQTPVPDYELVTYPDGGLIGSTSDLAKYCMHMIRGYKGEASVISASSFQTMMQNQYDTEPLKRTATQVESRQGIFWDIFGTSGTGDIGHSGSDPGILTFMYFHPTSGIGCILMTNCDSKNQRKAIFQIWELLIRYRNNLQASPN